MKPKFVIIGCGRVGTALAARLAKAGYRPAGFASRGMDSARAAARAAGADHAVFEHAWDAAKQADLTFITTPDQSIEEACRLIAQKNGFQQGSVVLHCSGALASTILSSVKPLKAYAGSMHPLQSFATEQPGNPFEGIRMAVEGDDAAVRAAQAVSSDLGAIPFTIRTEGKMLYHAAAVVASNYLVTLMGLAFQLLEASGVSRAEALQVLNPLIMGTLKNIETVGIPDALTGPIARGDVETVEKHLEAMGTSMPPAILSLYRHLGRATIEIALAKGTLSEAAAARLKKILA